MPFQLLPAKFEDGQEISYVMSSAFYPDKFNQVMFPGVPFEKQLAGTISRWPFSFQDKSAYFLKVVDIETGKIVSYSKWNLEYTDAVDRLDRSDGSDGEVPQPGTPEGLNDAMISDFRKKKQEIRDRILGQKPQLILSMIGTLPSYQRKGAGNLHLQWAGDFADQEGLTCWTEGSPVGVSLYGKYGFEAQEEIVTDLSQWGGEGVYVSTCMLRKPRKKVVTV